MDIDQDDITEEDNDNDNDNSNDNIPTNEMIKEFAEYRKWHSQAVFRGQMSMAAMAYAARLAASNFTNYVVDQYGRIVINYIEFKMRNCMKVGK